MTFLKPYLKALIHPITQINALFIGFMILVGMIHNHAHHTMEVDTDSYVRNFCKKNSDYCSRLVDTDEY